MVHHAKDDCHQVAPHEPTEDEMIVATAQQKTCRVRQTEIDMAQAQQLALIALSRAVLELGQEQWVRKVAGWYPRGMVTG